MHESHTAMSALLQWMCKFICVYVCVVCCVCVCVCVFVVCLCMCEFRSMLSVQRVSTGQVFWLSCSTKEQGGFGRVCVISSCMAVVVEDH